MMIGEIRYQVERRRASFNNIFDKGSVAWEFFAKRPDDRCSLEVQIVNGGSGKGDSRSAEIPCTDLFDVVFAIGEGALLKTPH
jgi:hypothetical protein